MKKVLIVGGVAGGAAAAARLRRLDENLEIIMFEKGSYISFANCGLPYYLGGTIKKRNMLFLWSPEEMKARFNIDVRINNEVIAVDAGKKMITVRNTDKNSVYEESFDYLVLAPGAKPIKPNIPGIENNKIFTLRNVPDTDQIKDYLDKNNVQSIAVIGGGFIGVEMAESFIERGLDVTLIEAAPHILMPFDEDMSVICEQELNDNGVDLILNDGVKSFAEEDGYIATTLAGGNTVWSDIVILAIGVSPDTNFLKDSGILMSQRGHIIVDEFMKTNFDYIYAAGDAVEIVDFVTKKKTAVPLAGPASKQGRIVADNICGLKSKYNGAQGTSIIKVCTLTAACTGANEKTLRKNEIPYKAIHLHPHSHAGYYPNASFMTMKLLYNAEGRILGCQAVGRGGIDKRIDVVSTVMRLGGSVSDLAELELTYAPPYSSAKDPVNMAGFMAQNELSGLTENITFQEMSLWRSAEKELNFLLLDVRTKEEFEDGHIKGSVNIPVDELRTRLNEIDKQKDIVVYCQLGIRGYVAGRILAQNGIKAKNLAGGYRSHAQANFAPDGNVFRGKPEK